MIFKILYEDYLNNNFAISTIKANNKKEAENIFYNGERWKYYNIIEIIKAH